MFRIYNICVKPILIDTLETQASICRIKQLMRRNEMKTLETIIIIGHKPGDKLRNSKRRGTGGRCD